MLKRLSMIHLAVYGLYLAAVLLVTWPLLTVFSTHFLGHPFGDAYEYARHIWWIKHALQTGDSIFFQPLLAYPDGIADVWLWGIPLQSFPAWLFAFVLPLPAAFNLGAVLTLAANGWALYWLLWRLTAIRPAAFLAGLIFMLYPHFQGQLGAAHTGLLVLWPVPFYIWNLLALTRADHTRAHGLLAAFFFVLSLLGSQLLLIYLLLPVTLLLLGMTLYARQWRALGRMLLSITGGGVLSLVFLLPILITSLNQAAGPSWLQEAGDVAFSADALGVVTPSFQHPLFTHLPHTHTILGIDPFERVAYVGLIAALLVLVGVVKWAAARPWLLLAMVAWVLSLGPLLQALGQIVTLHLGDYTTGVALPWLLLQSLPVLNITRTPARFNFAIALAVAIMAGYGAAALFRALRTLRLKPAGASVVLSAEQRNRWWWLERGLVGFLAVLIVFEYQFFWPFPVIPGVVPEPIAALSTDDSVRVVFDVPWQHLLTQKDGLFLQTGHYKPLIAGHVTRRTPIDPARPTLLQTTLDPVLLNAAEVDVIMLHKRWDESGETSAFTRQMLGAPFYEDDTLAAFRVPAVDETAPADFIAAPMATPARIEQAVTQYFYAPQAGWLTLDAEFIGAGRDVTLWLDQQPLSQVLVDDETLITLPIPVMQAGYHTLTVSLDPPCPVALDTTLACRTVDIQRLDLTDFTPTPAFDPVALEQGITLNAANATVLTGDQLTVGLWWLFDQPRTLDDVRFVHVLTPDGQLVAQQDQPLGEFAAGTGALDLVEIPLAGLPPGEYRVTAGWYRYPATTPNPRLDRTVAVIELGHIMVEE